MRRVNWKNVMLFGVLVGTMILLLSDCYELCIKPIFTGYSKQLTCFGTITFIANLVICGDLYEHFFWRIKKEG